MLSIALFVAGMIGQASSDSAIQAVLDRLAGAENRRDADTVRELITEPGELPEFSERRPLDERGPISYKVEKARLVSGRHCNRRCKPNLHDIGKRPRESPGSVSLAANEGRVAYRPLSHVLQ